jgi:hypothetical protein
MKTVFCPACESVNGGANINSVCSRCGELLAPAYFQDNLAEIKRLTTRFEEHNAPSFNSYNGFGTTLLDYRARPDGTYEATRWVIALFLPIFPLATYVIRPTGQERTYGRETSKFRVVGRVPLTNARILRTYILAVVGLLPVITGFAYSNVVNRALGGIPAFLAMILCFAWAFYIIFFRLKNEGAAYKAAVAA